MIKHIAKPHYLHIAEADNFIYELDLYEIEKSSSILIDHKFIKRNKPLKIKKEVLIVSKEKVDKKHFKVLLKSISLVGAPKNYIK
jgi:hypothetical protein